MKTIDISIETDPTVSWLENRNGMPDIKEIKVDSYGAKGEAISLTGVGKSGTWLRGGLVVNRDAFRKMCQEFLMQDMPEDQRKYINNEGNVCPKCGLEQVETTSCVGADGSSAWQSCRCGSCEAEWNDIYNLAGYEEEKHDSQKSSL